MENRAISKTVSNRNAAIDVMKGIAILSVIMGHFESVPSITHWIFSFHMPLFFFIAGFLHKRTVSREVFVKDVKRLLLPYAFTMGILLFYSTMVNCLIRQNLHQLGLTFLAIIYPTGTSYANSVPIWFLFALFWSRLLFGSLLRIYKRNLSACIAILIGLSITYIKEFIPFELPFAIMAGLSALVFYGIGFMYHQYYQKIPKITYVLLLICWIVFYRFCSINMISCYYSNYPLAIVCALGGIVGIYALSLLIIRAKGKGIIEWFGINSLIILTAHTIERYLPFTYSILAQYITIWWIFLIKVIICTLFTLLCYKFAFTRYIYSLSN